MWAVDCVWTYTLHFDYYLYGIISILVRVQKYLTSLISLPFHRSTCCIILKYHKIIHPILSYLISDTLLWRQNINLYRTNFQLIYLIYNVVEISFVFLNQFLYKTSCEISKKRIRCVRFPKMRREQNINL